MRTEVSRIILKALPKALQKKDMWALPLILHPAASGRIIPAVQMRHVMPWVNYRMLRQWLIWMQESNILKGSLSYLRTPLAVWGFAWGGGILSFSPHIEKR